MKDKMPLRYFGITFLWSWFFWGLVIFLGHWTVRDTINVSPVIKLPFMILALFGPVTGACVSLHSLEGKGAVKSHLKSFLSLNFGRKVWLSIFFGIGIVAVISWYIPELFGESRLAVDFPNVYMFPLYFLYNLILTVFLVGGQEEIGWRGYIMPYLEKRFGLITGSLILGIIWTIWHLPLWFIPEMNHQYMHFFGFMIQCIGLSYFFSWVSAASGNRLFSASVAHGAVNAFVNLFPNMIQNKNALQIRFWVFSILAFMTGIILVIIRTNKSRKNGT